MKVYLDDERSAPEGWCQVYNVSEAVILLQDGHTVTELSLDHDLGDESNGTGYQVVAYMEEKVATSDWKAPPIITVHSANPVGRANMEAGIRNIRRLEAQREAHHQETRMYEGWGC